MSKEDNKTEEKRWVKVKVNGQTTYIHTNKDKAGVNSYVKRLKETKKTEKPNEVEIYLTQNIPYSL